MNVLKRCCYRSLKENPKRTVVTIIGIILATSMITAVACMAHRPTDFNVTAEIPIHVGREIPCIPFYRPGSPELAKAVIEAMKDHNSVFLLKHGQVVCGKDFDQAFERAMFFEMACRIVLTTGKDHTVLTDAEIADLDKYILGKVQK